jgi:hypothetical protein
MIFGIKAPFVMVSALALVVVSTIIIILYNQTRSCIKYQTQHINEMRVGRRCSAFMCKEYETVPAHDEQVCVEWQP